MRARRPDPPLHRPPLGGSARAAVARLPLLVVDLDAAVRDLAARTLRDLALVRAVATRREALEQIAAQPRWLGALLDVDLGDGRDCFELVALLRARDPALAITVCTSQVHAGVVNEADRLGVACVAKPLEAALLGRLARRARAGALLQHPRLVGVVEDLVARCGLSEREAAVVAHAVGGLERQALPSAVGVSASYYPELVEGMLRKTRAASTDQLVMRVLRAALSGASAAVPSFDRP